MQELAGKTAFVTGAASGIGFALSRTFAEIGMKVMLADIETDALTAAVESLRDFRPNVRAVQCDVADPATANRRQIETGRRPAFIVRAGRPSSNSVSTRLRFAVAWPACTG